MELLRAWEQWPGTSTDFYRDLRLSNMQMVTLIKKGKKLIKNGTVFPDSEFKEIKIDPSSGQVHELGPCTGVELIWNNGRIIKFSQVELLLDFLKKAA